MGRSSVDYVEEPQQRADAIVLIGMSLLAVVRARSSKGVVGAGRMGTRPIERLILDNGYVQVPGGKGSHRKFSKSGSPMIILPDRREALSPRVLRNVAHALNLKSIGDLRALI